MKSKNKTELIDTENRLVVGRSKGWGRGRNEWVWSKSTNFQLQNLEKMIWWLTLYS